MLRDAQVPEDGADDGGVDEKGEDPHGAVAGGTAQRVDLVDAGQELRPAPAGAAATIEVVAPSNGGLLSRVGIESRLGLIHGVRPLLASEPRRFSAPSGVRCEDAVIAVPMHARRRDQSGEPLQQFDRRELDRGTAGAIGARKGVDQAGIGRCQRG